MDVLYIIINSLVLIFYLQRKRNIRVEVMVIVRERRETSHAEETITTDARIEVLLTDATEIGNTDVTVTMR